MKAIHEPDIKGIHLCLHCSIVCKYENLSFRSYNSSSCVFL